jgi:hypothetical protein
MATFKIGKSGRSINASIGDLYALKIPMMTDMLSKEGKEFSADLIDYFSSPQRARWEFDPMEIDELIACIKLIEESPPPPPRVKRNTNRPTRVFPTATCSDCEEEFGLAPSAKDPTRCPVCRIEHMRIRDINKAAEKRASKARAGG